MRSLYFALRQKAQAWWQHYYPIEITLTIRRRPRPKKRRIATTAPLLVIGDEYGGVSTIGGQTFTPADNR